MLAISRKGTLLFVAVALCGAGCEWSWRTDKLNPEKLEAPFTLVEGAVDAEARAQPDGTLFMDYSVEADPERVKERLDRGVAAVGWEVVEDPWFDVWHDVSEGGGRAGVRMLKTVWRGDAGRVFSYNIEYSPSEGSRVVVNVEQWLFPPEQGREYLERWLHMKDLMP